MEVALTDSYEQAIGTKSSILAHINVYKVLQG